LATDPPNTLNDGGVRLCDSGTTYFQKRWGDYTAIVGDDPMISPNQVWFSAMHSDAGGNWATCIARDGFIPPP
jgi:hypothetical protein